MTTAPWRPWSLEIVAAERNGITAPAGPPDGVTFRRCPSGVIVETGGAELLFEMDSDMAGLAIFGNTARARLFRHLLERAAKGQP